MVIQDLFLVKILQAFQKLKLRIQTESARIIIINYSFAGRIKFTTIFWLHKISNYIPIFVTDNGSNYTYWYCYWNIWRVIYSWTLFIKINVILHWTYFNLFYQFTIMISSIRFMIRFILFINHYNWFDYLYTTRNRKVIHISITHANNNNNHYHNNKYNQCLTNGTILLTITTIPIQRLTTIVQG